MSVHRNRYLLLLAYALIALPPIGYGAWQALATNANSPLDWVANWFPPRHTYEQFRHAFGAGDVVVISWPGCTLDDPRLERLAKVLRQSSAFRDDQGHWLFERVVTGAEAFQSLTAAPMSLPPREAVRRLRGTLLGPDEQTTCAVVTFTQAGLAERQRLVALIRGALRYFCHLSADQSHLAGPVIDGLSVDVASQRALDRFAVPSAIVIVLVCWYCLGSLRAALLIFVVSLYSQAAALALVHYGGDQMNALLIVMPPLIQVLSIAGGLHLVNYYFDAVREAGYRGAAERALRAGWLPLVLSAGTTAVGLASLMASKVVPIRTFGAYTSAGVALAAALLLAIVPGTFAIWPIRPPTRPGAGGAESPHGQAGAWWTRWTVVMADHHRAVVIVACIAMVVMGYGATRLNTSVRIETLFAPGSRILADYAWLEQHVGPLVPIELVVHCGENCHLTPGQRLALVTRIERRVAEMPEVGGTISAATWMPPAMTRPGAEAVLANFLPLLINRHYLVEHGQEQDWRITARVGALSKIDYGVLLGRVRNRVEPLLRGAGPTRQDGVTVRYTGIMPLVHAIQRQLMTDLLTSFFWALAIIAAVMTIAQSGLAAGLIAMIPNIFPIVILFGALGWWRIDVDIGTVMTASVALGIAVDDTLHFLTFFRRGLDMGNSRRGAVDHALRHCGAAMVQTTVTCSLGLSVFALSRFVPTSRFAWMMVAMLATALAGDLVVLPALLLSPLGKWFAVAASEPAQPRLSIPGQTQAAHRGERRRVA